MPLKPKLSVKLSKHNIDLSLSKNKHPFVDFKASLSTNYSLIQLTFPNPRSFTFSH